MFGDRFNLDLVDRDRRQYWVIDTNYTDYSVVLSCNSLYPWQEEMFILSRQPAGLAVKTINEITERVVRLPELGYGSSFISFV